MTYDEGTIPDHADKIADLEEAGRLAGKVQQAADNYARDPDYYWSMVECLLDMLGPYMPEEEYEEENE